MSRILEIIISLAGIFLFYSLFCSALLEAWAQNRGTRGRFLRERIMQVFGDGSTFDRILGHPILSGLVSISEKKPGTLKQVLGRMSMGHLQPADRPVESAVRASNASYLPGELFAEAALAVASGRTLDSAPGNLTQIRAGILGNELIPPYIKEQLVTHIDSADQSLEKARANVANWYNNIMERLSGTYQRYAKQRLLVIGFVGAIVMNIDAVGMYQSLSTDEAMRKSVAASIEERYGELAAKVQAGNSSGQAAADVCQWAMDEKACREAPEEYFRREFLKNAQTFSKSGLPIGWAGECTRLQLSVAGQRTQGEEGVSQPESSDPLRKPDTGCIATLKAQSIGYWPPKIMGFFLSGLFVSFGAPFWFDLLNLVFRFRSSGTKPAEDKSDKDNK